MTDDGRGEAEVRRRIQSAAGAYRKVAGVLGDRRISKEIRRKVLVVCVLPALTYGLETMALTREQQKRIQVCENNWVRRLCGARLIDKRRLTDLREEVGLDRTVTQRLVEKRLKWAGHVARMNEDRLAKRAERMDGTRPRGRGRPRVRWSDCIRRDLTGAEEDVGGDTWRERAEDREKWRQIVAKAIAKSALC